MNETFQLGVMISVMDAFSSTLASYMSQMQRAKTMTESMQAAMGGYKMMFAVGAGITAAGALGADALLKMSQSAGKLQTAMLGVSTSVKMSRAQLNALTNEVQTVGIPTQFSSIQVAGIAQAVAQAGIPNTSALASLLPEFVQFADVQAFKKGENPNTAAGLAMTMAHNYQLYSADKLAPFLNSLNSLLTHTNDTMSEVATAWKYASPTMKMLGVSPEQGLTAIGYLGRMGLSRGRVGTDLRDFLQRLVMGAQGGETSRAGWAMLETQMGMPVTANSTPLVSASGKFVGWPQALKFFQQYARKMKGQGTLEIDTLNSIFGAQGGLVAQLLASGNSQAAYNLISKQMGQSPGIASTQKQYNMTLQGQMLQFKTTLTDIGQAFGRQGVLAPMTGLLHAINDVLAAFLHLVQQHPLLDKFIGGFMMLATAAALIVGPMLMVAGAVGMLSLSMKAGALAEGIGQFKTMISLLRGGAVWVQGFGARLGQLAIQGATTFGSMLFGANALTVSIGGLDIALGPLLLIIAGVAAVGAAVYLVWKNWGTITHWLGQQVSNLIHWFDHLSPVVQVLLTLFTPLGAIVDLFTHWGDVVHWVSQQFKDLSNWWHHLWGSGSSATSVSAQQARFGTGLVDSYAKGVSNAPKGQLHKAMTNLAQIPHDYLALHSPARTGPLSTLNNWWTAFVPTLLQGLTGGAGNLGAAASEIGNLLFGGLAVAGAGAGGSAGAGSIVIESGAIVVQPGAIVVRTDNARLAADEVLKLLSGVIAQDVGRALRQQTRARPTRAQPHQR